MNTNSSLDQPSIKPEILTYLSPLKFLDAYYLYRKSMDKSFSFESWSYELGFKGPSMARMVTRGERMISDDFIEIFSTQNEFSEEQKNYFILLAKYQNTKSNSLKKVYLDKILSNVKLMTDKMEVKNYIGFLSSPAVPIIQLVIAYDGFKATEEKLKSVLNMDSKKLNQGLKVLEDMGLIQSHTSESEKTKIWTTKVKHTQVPDHILNEAVNFFHKETTKEASQILDKNILDKRFRSIYFSMTEEDFLELKSETEEFLTRVKNKYGNNKGGRRKFFKMNLQTYPLTEDLES